MLEARSVAVVGASVREGSVGNQSLVELRDGGFEGAVYPVNPKYDEVLGWRCYPTVADIGEPVDLVILGVANALLEEQLSLAARSGARSAVIFASCYEPPREGVPPLTARLAAIARDAGMAICGGNCMGFANLWRNVRALGFYEPKGLRPGGLVFISHSGSAFSALLHNDRGLRFGLGVSSGQEFVTTAADYLRYALEQPETSAIGLFIETVRDPGGFREAMRLAGERDVPVVALKVGREELTRTMVSAHSGALAGEDGAYEALFASRRRAPAGGLAAMHDSGGERALLVDAAASIGVPLARISEDTTKRLAAALEEGLLPVNPLDFWGTGRDAPEVIKECARALLDDPDTAALAFGVDLTTEDNPDMGYVAMATEVFPETDKPFAMLSSFAAGIDRSDVPQLYEAGVPVLEGTLTGLAAFKHLFDYRDHRALPPLPTESPVPADVRDRWRARLSNGQPIGEVEGLRLLSDYGVPTVETATADTLEEAVGAAERLGWPVALKTAMPEIQHKSDVDGVRLGLATPDEVADAYRELAERLGPRVTVATMAPPGVEMALGIVRDPQFGPLVLVAAGGILVELLKDRCLGLPPLDETRATRLIDRLRARPLLGGIRGQPAADVLSLAEAVVDLSWLAHDLGDNLEALDANPVICGPDGCVAVDALVVPRS
jgi:acyl-CoA synthetase (NDP forming)